MRADELPEEVLEAIRRRPFRAGVKRWTNPAGRKAGWFNVLLLPLSEAAAWTKDPGFQPAPMPVVRAMLDLAHVGRDDVVYDLGAGDGRVPITAAAEYGARGVGVEIDPARVEQARRHARDLGVEDRVTFIAGDVRDADLRPATVAALFLHAGLNLTLRPKLLAQLAPGSRVVSYAWNMDDWRPDAERRLGDVPIYLWRVP